MTLKSIRSGGQTGADQAGSEAAIQLGLEPGGWIPKGRRTNIGRLTDRLFERYKYHEHTSVQYSPRTEQNGLDSDGTVLFGNVGSPGCALTIRLCQKHGKPYIINPTKERFLEFLEKYEIEVLNCAGNREETNKGIFARTLGFLVSALS